MTDDEKCESKRTEPQGPESDEDADLLVPSMVERNYSDESFQDADREGEICGDVDESPAGNADQCVANSEPQEVDWAPTRLVKLPISRLKAIIKAVPTVHLVNSEAIALISKATEMFIGYLVSESHQITIESGKKTLTMAHIEQAIQWHPQLEFLDGMLL
uniref:CBFD_NFYB_HMF domain-containing protein n=1 Tax=Mesocestoides corti TaxID=53468 RepID=A0A5K3FGA8_MESCO